MLTLEELTPEVHHLLCAEAFSPHSPTKELIAYLAKALDQGHLALPLDAFDQKDKDHLTKLIQSADPSLINFEASSEAKPIYYVNNCLYIHKAFHAESTFLKELSRYLKTFEGQSALDFTCDPECTEKQNEAIKKSLEPGMLILTGGPGTGKTFTAKKIALNLLEKSPFFKKTLILAAPTSKALSQLKKSVGSLKEDIQIISGTLHKLLEFRSKNPAYLNGSCIIVDEASMIEAPLMAKLFASLGSCAKLILIGDPFQLPPVGLGALFQDLIQHQAKFPFINHVHLDQVKRCKDLSLAELSTIIIKKSYEDFKHFLSQTHDHIKILDQGMDPFSEHFLKTLSEFFQHESYFLDHLDDLSVLKSHSIILSTLRQGPLGVDAINQKLKHYFFNQHSQRRFFAHPIMILENAPELDLFNGETGWEIYDRQTQKTQYFIKKTLLSSLGVSYTPSFALSVHKSQGSEYDHVLFMVPEGSEKFSKEIVYTACTRVKKTLKLWFDDKPLQGALSKKTSRLSGLFNYANSAFL